MNQIGINDIAKETLYILDYFNPVVVSKIPNHVLKLLKEFAEKSYILVNIDKNKKLKDQNISDDTKDLLSLIYYNYIATESEKKEILEIWNKNELLYQRHIKIKYNIDDIFKKKIVQEENELIITENKENILQKIIYRINKFFCNKN